MKKLSMAELALGVIVLIATFVGVASLRAPADAEAEPFDFSLVDGRELALVLIVSPSCPSCAEPVMVELWRKAVELGRARASSDQARLTLTALSLSPSGASGVEFVARFGSFHEVMSGRTWQSIGARHYIWDALPGPPVVPQVALIARNVETAADGTPVVGHEEVLERHVGLEAITRWVAAPR